MTLKYSIILFAIGLHMQYDLVCVSLRERERLCVGVIVYVVKKI